MNVKEFIHFSRFIQWFAIIIRQNVTFLGSTCSRRTHSFTLVCSHNQLITLLTCCLARSIVITVLQAIAVAKTCSSRLLTRSMDRCATAEADTSDMHITMQQVHSAGSRSQPQKLNSRFSRAPLSCSFPYMATSANTAVILCMTVLDCILLAPLAARFASVTSTTCRTHWAGF